MRYRDNDGHIRFKFVGPEDRFPASRKPEPHSQFQERPWPTTSGNVVTKAPDNTAGSLSKR
jgi:hypothetical protein